MGISAQYHPTPWTSKRLTLADLDKLTTGRPAMSSIDWLADAAPRECTLLQRARVHAAFLIAQLMQLPAEEFARLGAAAVLVGLQGRAASAWSSQETDSVRSAVRRMEGATSHLFSLRDALNRSTELPTQAGRPGSPATTDVKSQPCSAFIESNAATISLAFIDSDAVTISPAFIDSDAATIRPAFIDSDAATIRAFGKFLCSGAVQGEIKGQAVTSSQSPLDAALHLAFREMESAVQQCRPIPGREEVLVRLARVLLGAELCSSSDVEVQVRTVLASVSAPSTSGSNGVAC